MTQPVRQHRIWRRRLRWPALVLTILIASIWFATRWLGAGYSLTDHASSYQVQCTYGTLYFVWYAAPDIPHGPIHASSSFLTAASPDFSPQWTWLPEFRLRAGPHGSFTYARSLFVTIPLWVPLILCAVLTTWLWRGRRVPEQCPKCGYSLAGNTSGVCPECGSAGSTVAASGADH